MKALEKLSSIPFPTKLLWLILLLCILMLMLMLYLNRFVSGKEGRITQALEDAHRVEYLTEEDELVGNVAESIAAKETRKKAEALAKKKEEEEEEEELQAETEVLDVEKKPTIDTLAEERLILESNQFDETTNKSSGQFDEVNITDITKNPAIIVVVTGLGLSSTSTSDAMELPESVTLGFSPYAPQLDEWITAAKQRNHEVMINIPMQTYNMKKHDPGPYALFQTVTAKDNLTRLKMLLDLVKGRATVYSDKHEVFSNSAVHIEPILKLFLLRKIWYVYGGGHQNMMLSQVSNKLEYPLMVADLYIDEEIDNASINAKLQEAKEIAQKKGYAIVFARPYPITIRMLQRWIPMLSKQGIDIVPISKFTGKYIVDKDAKNAQ
jgi:polysaccharide deacetylase 2 family uncharacterized protein YibQ